MAFVLKFKRDMELPVKISDSEDFVILMKRPNTADQLQAIELFTRVEERESKQAYNSEIMLHILPYLSEVICRNAYGWRGITDDAGAEMIFSTDKLAEIFATLPAALMSVAGALPELFDVLKGSPQEKNLLITSDTADDPGPSQVQ